MKKRLAVLLAAAFIMGLASARAEDFTTNLIDGFATNAPGDFRVGETGSHNVLLITNAGVLFSANAIVGNSSAALSNLAHVAGAGSTWSNSGPLKIGHSGAVNRLLVFDGAKVFVSNASTVGVASTAHSNGVVLSGSGSFWRTATVGPVIGATGSWNSVVISNGARVEGNSAAIGSRAGHSNTAIVEGPGSSWTNFGTMTIGSSGSGNQLIVTNGGLWHGQDTTFVIGSSGSSNRVVVTGSGSRLVSPHNTLTIGASGTANRLWVSDAAFVQTVNNTLGSSCSGNNNVAWITDPGTIWTNRALTVGFCSSDNLLVISNGAAVWSVGGQAMTSVQGGTGNTVQVTGPGSLWRIVSPLAFALGNAGYSNRLVITDGAKVVSPLSTVGGNGRGTVALVTGAGSSWSNETLTVSGSSGGSHQLVVSNGARIDSHSVYISGRLNADLGGNTVIASGTGTVWNVQTNLFAGYYGRTNLMAISGGARVNARAAFIGFGSTNTDMAAGNVLRLAGPDSTLVLSSNLYVGYYGPSNTLQITDGATISSSNAWLGLYGNPKTNTGSCRYHSGHNTASVSGPGSLWDASGEVVVGGASMNNLLTVSNAGTLATRGLLIGAASGVFTSSPGCEPVPTNNVVIIDGGLVIVSNATVTASFQPLYGRATIRSGTLIADKLILTNTAELIAYGASPRVEHLGGTVQSRGFFIDNGQPYVAGDGLRAAKLVVDGTGHTFAGGLEISSNSALAAHGLVVAAITNAGTLSVADHGDTGNFLIDGSLNQASAGAMFFEIAGISAADEYDVINVLGGVALAGRLQVALRNGFSPGPGHSFTLIAADVVNGTFDNAINGARLKTTDHLGSFLVTYTGTEVTLSDYQAADADGDGIEDAWANLYFGHSPLSNAEKLADADGDGMGNYEEFIAGTNPTNAGSALVLTVTGDSSGVAVVQFGAVPGKSYRLWYTGDLTTPWTEVTGALFAWAAPDRLEWIDDGALTGGMSNGAKFYRVTVE